MARQKTEIEKLADEKAELEARLATVEQHLRESEASRAGLSTEVARLKDENTRLQEAALGKAEAALAAKMSGTTGSLRARPWGRS